MRIRFVVLLAISLRTTFSGLASELQNAFPPPSPTPVVDSQLLNDLHKNAVPEWDRMEVFIDNIDISYSDTTRDREKGINPRGKDISGERRFIWDSARGVSKRIGTANHGEIHFDAVCNREYGFEAGAATKADPLSLSDVGFTADFDPKVQFFEDGMPVYMSARQNVSCGCRLLHYTLRALVDDKDHFELLEVSRRDFADRPHILIVSRHRGKHIHPDVIEKGTYSVLIDPARCYLKSAARIDFPEMSYAIREDVEYRPMDAASDVQWFPRRYVSTSYFHADDSTHTEEVVFETPKKCTTPDAEFRLPHYGFSEEVLKSIKPNPWPRRWMILLGLAGLAIAGWFFRSRRDP